jgi:hypothetical protein
MHPVCRRALDNLYTRVEETALLYKEGPGVPCQPWCEQPAASRELFCLGSGGTATGNLAAGECEVCW